MYSLSLPSHHKQYQTKLARNTCSRLFCPIERTIYVPRSSHSSRDSPGVGLDPTWGELATFGTLSAELKANASGTIKQGGILLTCVGRIIITMARDNIISYMLQWVLN